jgi:predicted O-linked N-acetylglucosamine transferase (SPINDLY family)
MGVSDAQAADLIRQDEIDILVDLSMHTSGNRLLTFAYKPAPVQVTYLAYAGSSGLTTMDYRLSDPYLDPPGGDESAYSERTVRLPETYWCYLPVDDLPPARLPTADKDLVIFGCLNNFCKVNEPLLALWARLLASVPQSQLLLHAGEGAHRRRVVDYLHERGVDEQRISFVERLPVKRYFERYQCIDIALDTFPYAGGTTTCDALWMGVPVVSLAGTSAVGRVGVSVLSNLGLPELVAHAPDQYVQIALGLANDLPRLKELRSTLRPRMEASPLMDAPRFARNIEAAYRAMWINWCAQVPAGASPSGSV